jgi:hypothetical protein
METSQNNGQKPNFKLSIQNAQERKEDLLKQLQDIENDILKVAGEEIVGGAYFAPAYNQSHSQSGGGWLKSS